MSNKKKIILSILVDIALIFCIFGMAVLAEHFYIQGYWWYSELFRFLWGALIFVMVAMLMFAPMLISFYEGE